MATPSTSITISEAESRVMEVLWRKAPQSSEDVVAALVSAAGPDSLVFEAPREDQQAWFVRRFGPDVNLANVHPADALGLETLRLSLRADTYGAWTPGSVPADRT